MTIQTDVSKQVSPFPATISRGPIPHLLSWRAFYTRHGYLSTDRLRHLGNWGLPGAAKATLIHQMTGLNYQILNSQREPDRQSEYYTLLVENANDGVGGPVVFLNRFADDILNALQGGLFETVRSNGIPIALYNVDASTIIPTFDPNAPFYQRSPYSGKAIPFTREEMAQTLWYPFVEIESPHFSRTPVQLAYSAIQILSSGDDYNIRLLKEVIPQAILNLGPGFDLNKARQWKEEWDKAKESGRLQDIGLLYGTDNAQLLKLFPPPKDMGFENLEHWYATIIASCFEMSILDLGIITKVSTKAAAESQERVSKRQGLRHLLQLVKLAMEFYVLPEGYSWEWEDIDPTDEKDDAEIKWRRAIAVRMLCDALGQDLGRQEAARQGLLTQETRDELEAITRSQIEKAAGEGQGVGGSKQGIGGTDWCVCPDCDYRTEHKRGTACADMKCPKCGSTLVGEHAITKAAAGFENLPIPPLTNMMAEMYEAVERLVQALQENEITVATFEEGMDALLREYYVRVYEAVEGEPSPEADYFMETLIEDELAYLAGFASDLRQELEDTGGISGKAGTRASLYVSHLNSAWQRILLEKLPPIEPQMEYIIIWHLTPGAEHCNTCLMMSQGGPYTLEELRAINIFPGHNTECLANCMCYLEIRMRERVLA